MKCRRTKRRGGSEKPVVVGMSVPVRAVVGRGLHFDVLMVAETVRGTVVGAVEGTIGPATRAVRVEEFVEGEFNGGARDGEPVGVAVGIESFAIGHDVRESGCWIQ